MPKKNKPIQVQSYDVDRLQAEAYYGLGDTSKIIWEDKSPLMSNEWKDPQKVIELAVDLCRDPAYLHFVCKYFLNVELPPYQACVLRTMWDTPFPLLLGSRGASKSMMLAILAMLKAMLHPECKVKAVGSSFRQALVLYNYIETIYWNAPVLMDMCGGKKGAPGKDPPAGMAYWDFFYSSVQFFPLGTGDKIRGQRANVVIADEIASIPPDIFDTVVKGFTAVKSTGYMQSIKDYAAKALFEKLGFETRVDGVDIPLPKAKNVLPNNQIIVSGTATYQFNHFFKYFERYRTIIQSGGNAEVLRKAFPDMTKDEIKLIKPENYCIIRIPYDKIPGGAMDADVINQSKATMDQAIFDHEYRCIFSADSAGFILASDINKATCPTYLKDETQVSFVPSLHGDPSKICVMGIDPASEMDNFAINILQIDDRYRGLVYSWTCNRKEFQSMIKDKLIPEGIEDYNTFLIFHIRKLLKNFNIQMICCDAGGGGISLREGLKDPSKLFEDDQVILDVDDESNKNKSGRHILKMIEFSNAAWRRDAHYAIKQDIIDRIVLFPEYDTSILEEGRIERYDAYDTIDNVYDDIESCKTETARIRQTQTITGAEKWDVPEIKGIANEEARKKFKRDRFTSLMLANWAARILGDYTHSKVNTSSYRVVKRGKTYTSSSDNKAVMKTSRRGNRTIMY